MSAEREEAMRTFLARAGWGEAALMPLPGDASTRRYLRALKGERVAMLMDQPQGAESPPCPPGASEETRRALGYNAVARLAGADCARFVAVADYLRGKGLSAPEIYAAAPADGFVLMEDLGDRLYADVLMAGADEAQLYRSAAEALARLHAEPAPVMLSPEKPLYAYDETAMLAEIDLMTEWFFPVGLGRAAGEDEVAEHRALWRDALRPLSAAQSVFVHRDYHAQNLLWLSERPAAARVGLIDFQDAVSGSRGYDLVSLTEDARRDVAPELAEAATGAYLAAMRRQGTPLDEKTHRAEMAVTAAQRNAKIVGIFARLCRRDGKPRYLSHLPRVWGYLGGDLEHPALAPLKAWYDKRVPAERRGEPRLEGMNA
jgi:aminoglycoside/choline kinase family phosphotransferase